MQAVRADPDLGAEAELVAVGEAGGGVHEHRRRVHLGEEAARGAVVLGDDRLGEARRVARDEGEGGVERGHDGDAQDEIQVLGVPVRVGGGLQVGDEGAARRVAAELAAARAERGGDPGQEPRRDRLVHEQVLDRVAHARPLDLRVETDALRHGEVGALVHVEVADALEVLHHRDAALLEDGVLERLAAARDDDVDAVVALQEPARHLAPALDQLRGRGGQPGGLDLGAERPGDGTVRRLRLAAALEQHGVRGLETERGRVGGHVRARLVDREHDADRHAHLRDLEAVRPPPGGDRLAHGIGEGGDLLEAARHGVDAAGGQREAVDEGRALAGAARAGDVVRVGAEDGGLVASQARGRAAQRRVLGGRGRAGKRARRAARVARERLHHARGLDAVHRARSLARPPSRCHQYALRRVHSGGRAGRVDGLRVPSRADAVIRPPDLLVR